ncbi:MAG TPA: pyruvate, water dikinase regulatory protein, partial [Burkholderiales bacterium]|nr:pyruvate, water dikinase regulatory protein [Burkholderiales bacterium]
MKPRRTVFYLSDRTGITSEVLGKTLLTQFPDVEFRKRLIPFIDSPEKAREALQEINALAQREIKRPIVISTLIDDELRLIIEQANALCLDLFEGFIGKLENELEMPSSHALGLTHGIGNAILYERRMAAVNYALAHDDGLGPTHYNEADVILIGVSRTGKTPTCLYLAMQYGVHAANYPLTPEDFETMTIPKPIAAFRSKLFGLTITADRLAQIRHERRPDSKYAALDTCRTEIEAADEMFQRLRLPVLDTTAIS